MLQLSDLFKDLQRKGGDTPVNLTKDMKTRWNSTEHMIFSFLRLKVKIFHTYYYKIYFQKYVIEFVDLMNLSKFALLEWEQLKVIEQLSHSITFITKLLSGSTYLYFIIF